MSRGVEFQIRDQSQQHQPQHPGSLDYKLVQGDSFRRSKGILESRLRSIDEAQSSIQPDLHTGQPDCSSCVSKKRQIREAFQYYYLTPEPERWDTGVPQYREQMERMIHAEDKYSLHDLQSFHDVALRDHLRNDFCTPHSTDRPENSAVRRMVADMFDNSFPLSEIISEYMKGQINASGSIDAATFLMQLQNTRDQESRATIYQHYYCNNDNSDSSAVKALKVKYGRQFGDFIPHDVVISAMREEAERSHSHGIDQLKSKVNELQMAKSASMKEQKRRAEQADQRMIDKHAETSKHAECSLPGCHVKIDLMDETIECGLCDWLASKSSSRSRAMYCSIDHAEQDFVRYPSHYRILVDD